MDNLSLIADSDAETRLEAYEELVLEMDDPIGKAILAIATGDADEDVRVDAIVALGPIIEECGIDYGEEPGPDLGDELGPPVSREMFQTMLRHMRGLYSDTAQSILIRRRAFEVLVRDPQPWQKIEIGKHLKSEEPGWRLTAVFAMGQMAGFAKEIESILETAEGSLLFEAVRAAGRQEVNAAAPRILQLVESNEDLELQIEAIRALPHVHADCFEILDNLTHSNNSEIVEAALEALDVFHLRSELGEYDGDDLYPG